MSLQNHWSESGRRHPRASRLAVLLIALAALIVSPLGTSPAEALRRLEEGERFQIMEATTSSQAVQLQTLSTQPFAAFGCVGSVSDINVAVDVRDYDPSQLTLTLTHGRTIVTLVDGHRGFGGRMNVVFTDEAPIPISAAPSDPNDDFHGQVRPLEPLSAFDGHGPGGPWTLSVTDREDDDPSLVGSHFVESWSITATCVEYFDTTQGPVADTAVQMTGRAGRASSTIDAEGCADLVTDIDVNVVWEHPDNRDLTFTLSHGGRSVVLWDGAGFASTGGSVSFDDEAPWLIDGAFPPVDDVLHNPHQYWWHGVPTNSFAGFGLLRGGAGDWTLTIEDGQGGQGGELQIWQLDLTCGSPKPGLIPSDDEMPMPIGDTPSSAEFEVSDEACPGVVTDVNLDVNLEHHMLEDVELTLAHGDTVITLLMGEGVGSTGGAITFDDEGIPPVQITDDGPAARSNGVFMPHEALAAFNGMDGAGTWTLQAWDVAGGEPRGAVHQVGLGLECGEPRDELIVHAGAGRIQTAVEASRHAFPDDGSADAAVLAREDDFADALAGTPLAVGVGGPLLLTHRNELTLDTGAEMTRALRPGATVYLLGLEGALYTQVEADVASLGFVPRRLGGPSRFETAVAVAEAYAQDVAPPNEAFIGTGWDFPETLVAGATAPAVNGVLLLSNGDVPHRATVDYLDANPQLAVHAIGADAVDAHPTVDLFAGVDAYETAALLASAYHPDPTVVGIASGEAFPDALTGGAHIGGLGGPLLLTPKRQLAGVTESYLVEHADALRVAHVYGGTGAIEEHVRDAVRVAMSGAL